MKYKVGDKVKIVNYDNGGIFYGDMKQFMGKTMTICDISSSFYKMQEDNKYTYWHDKHIECLVSDLQEGDIVYVSDVSAEDALETKKERIFIYTPITNFKGLCVSGGDEKDYLNNKCYDVTWWGYTIRKPIEEKKERKIECTDSERENIKNTLNLK